jgi:membrane fusion protein, multidrug efflux system
MKRTVSSILAIILGLVSLSLPACDRARAEEEKTHEEASKIVVTSPQAKDVIFTQQYVCQIRSQRYIEIKPLQEGYLEEISIKEGQAVKQGDVLFKIVPKLYEQEAMKELARLEKAQINYENSKRLYDSKVVSDQELAIAKREMNEAMAAAGKAQAELYFTTVRAPFDGIIDRLEKQQGSLVEKKEILTTLSDNSVMWVYFNVPEARYLEFKARYGKGQAKPQRLELSDSKIELRLANGHTFPQSASNAVTIEGKFNNETGCIAFRSDFPNPDGLLRHGQTGNILIHRRLKNAIVIPQRSTFEILDKQYVWVVDKDEKVHQRLITIQHEMDDIFVVSDGLDVNDKIVLEGVRQVRDGDKVEYEFRKPEEALANMKLHAE